MGVCIMGVSRNTYVIYRYGSSNGNNAVYKSEFSIALHDHNKLVMSKLGINNIRVFEGTQYW